VKIEVSHLLQYPRERVWEVLLDPDVMSRVLPGIEKFESLGNDTFAVVMKLGVPAIKGTYTGTVQIIDKQPPQSYRLKGDGKGTAGWAKGEATMTLLAEGSGTKVVASGQAQIGGAIASLGQRMMDGVAKAMAKEFFESIDREMQGRQEKASQGMFALRTFIGMIWAFVERLFGLQEQTPPN
jgi:uncharacterized protein